ncbi:hypothetical protein [Streptomyces sp. NPDC047123]
MASSEAGIHGLAHPFTDGCHADEIITLIRDAGAFGVPCAVLKASTR